MLVTARRCVTAILTPLTVSGYIFPAALWILLVAASYSQDAAMPTFSTTVFTFGTTVVVPGGLTGRIYELPQDTRQLPNFEKLEPIGTIYTRQLFVPPREFTEGFPGVTSRVEWFAIDYTGRFYVADPGTYQFSLLSDDGSRLYIDKKLVIDADGGGWLGGKRAVKLDGGVHHIRVSYYQGPRYHLYLMLSVLGPRDRRFHPFNTDEFRPPSDLEAWNLEVPDDLTAPVRRNLKFESRGATSTASPPASATPDASRRNLKEDLRGPETEVPLSVRVISGHRPVLGLGIADFIVHDGNKPQELTSAAFNSQTLDIELLLDTSYGMRALNQEVQGSVKRAAGELAAADRVGVMEFGEMLRERLSLAPNRGQLFSALQFGDRSPSGDRLQLALRNDAMLRDAIRIADESKELNSALAVTAHALQNRARTDSRRAIVIVTDNRGAKGVPDRATRDALWRTNVIVCGLLVNSGKTVLPPSEFAGDVRPFIGDTGGELFNLDAKRVPLAEALQSIRDRYLLTYKAPGGEPKTIHSVSVDLSPAAKLRYPDARVLVRGGYVVGEEGERPPIPSLRRTPN